MDEISAGDRSYDAALDQLVELTFAAGSLPFLTDKYFSHTRRIVEANGDCDAVYAVFMRRRVIGALEAVERLLARLVPEAEITRLFDDGDLVPSESKILEVRGPYSKLSEVETLLLQKVGLPCVCANNAYEMCRALPYAGFLDMHGRHGSGPEMNLLAAFGASVGSRAARMADPAVKGFIGSSQDLTAPLYGAPRGTGTMPHSLIGYAGGEVLEALKLFAKFVPEAEILVALVDYAGREVSDSISCARWFYEQARLQEQGKRFGVRIDTHGGRFAEGLDYEKSVETVGRWLGVDGEYNIVEHVVGQRAFQLDPGNILIDKVRRILFGKGVSVAAVIHVREALDAAGFKEVRIVASSGFDAQKCQIAGAARAPIDVVGTGSFLPATLLETYATADIIAYDGVKRVKLGRENLF